MKTSLEKQHCKPCEGNVVPMTSNEINKLITQIPDWKVSEKNTDISRTFKFKNFFWTMSFVNALAHIVNLENHHPKLKIGYNYCTVSFSTHAIQGLSQNDFICARKVDILLENKKTN